MKTLEAMTLTRKDLMDAVLQRLMPLCTDYMGDSENGLVHKLAKEAVDSALAGVVKTRVAAAVDAEIQAIMAEGFPTTDGYGRTTGKQSIKDMLLEYAKINPRDCYHNPLVAAVRGFVEKECQGELARIRQEVRKQADELIGGKVVAALREGLGLMT